MHSLKPKVFSFVADNKIKKVDEYLSSGGNVNQKYLGVPLVAFSVTDSCNADMLKLLIEKGADINAVDENLGASLIHFSSQNKDISCLKYLIKNNAKIDIFDKKRRNAYFYAMDFNNQDAIKTLWLSGLDIFQKNDRGVDIIHESILLGNSNLFIPILEEHIIKMKKGE